MKNISYLLIGLFMSICQAQNDNKNYTDAFKLIDVWLESQKDYEAIPGITAMVVRDQDLVWSGAYGKSNIEQDTDIKRSTLCSICSITKTFTAVAIMKLVDEGKIKLDDKVKDILPHFKVVQKYPDGGFITIRSLLSHSSGLPRDSGHNYWSAPDFPFPSENELNAVLKELETESPVGANLSYSNLGYALLGQIIEQVSGMPFEQYLKTHVLIPLQMSDSYVGIKGSLYGNKHAVGYTAVNRNGIRKRANLYQTKAISPAAGLSTSILDLAKYASWQFRLRNASVKEVLNPSSLRKMHEVQSESKNGSRTWGFGFEVFSDKSGNKWVSHGGICPGYVSYLKMNLTNKMGYGLMVNSNRVNAIQLINGIMGIMKKAGSISKNDAKNIDLEEYTGYYNLNPWNSEYYISRWGKGLVALYLPAKNPVDSMYFYEHKGNDTFRLIGSDEEIVFKRDKNGKVYQVLNGGNYHPKMKY
ncbi:serine hydrolase [Leptobacterium flavescens]|uniref:Serine hydrolase n=1 Tax=Leptobacterium flavescens TaxID=472055 RepID=A0A6P0UQJ7_9FLAO|nr:serine hydrolase [Leptobacterium flavescens]NER15385.1 serine hydrolase [Leptobacterium flavescens]